MPRGYSLPDVLERIYHNQLALEAARDGADVASRAAGPIRGGRKYSGSPADD